MSEIVVTPGEAFILGWLSKADWSLADECDGPDLRHLIKLQLVELKPSNQPIIDRRYGMCRLTADGWKLFAKMKGAANDRLP